MQITKEQARKYAQLIEGAIPRAKWLKELHGDLVAMADPFTDADSRTIQTWPRGKGYSYQGDPYGPPEQRRLREANYNGPDKEEWRPGTSAEWRTIRIALYAERIAQESVLAVQSSLVDELLKEQREGFSIDDIENLYLNPEDWDAAQCREWLSDQGHDEPEIPTITCEACEGNGENVNDPIGVKCVVCKGAGEVPNPDADDDDTYVEELRAAVRDNGEAAEVYEWWLVDRWLCDELRAIGEVVLDNGYGRWWGRTATGQGLIMDGTLQQVAARHVAEGD